MVCCVRVFVSGVLCVFVSGMFLLCVFVSFMLCVCLCVYVWAGGLGCKYAMNQIKVFLVLIPAVAPLLSPLHTVN